MSGATSRAVTECRPSRSTTSKGAIRLSRGLGRPITYADIPFDAWAGEISTIGLPPHVEQHLVTMAKLHRQNRYDRSTDTVEAITGKPAQSIAEFVANGPTSSPLVPEFGDGGEVLGVGQFGDGPFRAGEVLDLSFALRPGV